MSYQNIHVIAVNPSVLSQSQLIQVLSDHIVMTGKQPGFLWEGGLPFKEKQTAMYFHPPLPPPSLQWRSVLYIDIECSLLL